MVCQAYKVPEYAQMGVQEYYAYDPYEPLLPVSRRKGGQRLFGWQRDPRSGLLQFVPLVTNCIEDERVYVQKAIGWVLRETGYVYRDEIRAYIEAYMVRMTGIAFTSAIDCFRPEVRKELIALRKQVKDIAR